MRINHFTCIETILLLQNQKVFYIYRNHSSWILPFTGTILLQYYKYFLIGIPFHKSMNNNFKVIESFHLIISTNCLYCWEIFFHSACYYINYKASPWPVWVTRYVERQRLVFAELPPLLYKYRDSFLLISILDRKLKYIILSKFQNI